MKIAMLGQKHTFSREGGIEVVVNELSTRMAALGHQVRSISLTILGNAFSAKEKTMYK